MYMGFRTNRYGPRIIRRRGGSNGAGVPLPIHAKVKMHHNAMTAPMPPMIIPMICGASIAVGRTMPDQDRTRVWQIDEQKPDEKDGVCDRPESNKHVYLRWLKRSLAVRGLDVKRVLMVRWGRSFRLGFAPLLDLVSSRFQVNRPHFLER